MRLLKRLPSGDFTLESCDDDNPPPYAILSHTWIADQEVTYQELISGAGKDKAGYLKIRFCGQRAASDRLEYFWVDTCCIDKSSNQELNTAINYMFRWYQKSSKCYVYLSDVSLPEDVSTGDRQATWEVAFQRSRWFTRGWTLQELLAPTSVEFFSRQGNRLGPRTSLEQQIHVITKLPLEVLQGRKVTAFSVEERFSWAANRETTWKEDRVYCLLGIFDVHLVPNYGEGEAYAANRLRREIQQQHTPLFANISGDLASGTYPQQTPARDVMNFENFLKWLSYPEMAFRYGDVSNVQDNTCRWLLNHVNYNEWKSRAESSSLLMIRGKPGSGKSTAMKRAYEVARAGARQGEAVVAFFFNSRGVSMETKLEGFFRSTLHQLLQNHGSTKDSAFKEWQQRQKSTRSGWTWTVNELQVIFEQYVVHSSIDITLFVDALDECESTDAAHDLMDLLTNLGACHDSGQGSLKACISSRHYPNVGIDQRLQIIVEKTNTDDIAQYTETTLQSFQRHDLSQLSEAITSRSEGMFLWAFLMLKKIRVAIRDREPLEELYAIIRGTPKRLEEVFQELIDGIPVEEREQSNLLISWILFAKRPLFLPELSHAWAFRTAYATYEQYEKSRNYVGPDQMMTLLAKYTRGLVEPVEIRVYHGWDVGFVPQFRVQFIHESVREYVLLRRNLILASLSIEWMNTGFVDHKLAESCFNYLRAVCNEAHVVNDITGRLQNRRFQIGQLCFDNAIERPFLEYAIQSGLEHAREADLSGFPPLHLYNVTSSEPWWINFVSLFRVYWERGYHSTWSGGATKHWSDCSTTTLAFACASSLDSWTDRLLRNGSPGLKKSHLSKTLCVAAASGNSRSVEALIQAGADVDYEEPNYGNALSLSLAHGQDHILPILLRHKATVRMGKRKHCPLVAAVSHQSVGVVTTLLHHGAEVAEREPRALTRHLYSPAIEGPNALEAALQRDFEILEVLLRFAERQQVPIEDYKAAYIMAKSSWRANKHAASLESAVNRLIPGKTTIQIFVNTIPGSLRTIEVWTDTKVIELKKALECRGEYLVDRVMFVYGSKLLRDHKTLDEYGIGRESTVHMLPRARWGGTIGG